VAPKKLAMSSANNNHKLPENTIGNMADADRMPVSSFPGAFLLVESGHCYPRSLCQRCRIPAHRTGMYQSEDHSVKAAHLDITTCINLVPYLRDVRERWELLSLVIDSVDENFEILRDLRVEQ